MTHRIVVASGLFFLSLIICEARGDWPMLAHDAARSGCTPTEIRPPFARKWYRVFPDEGLMAGVQPVIAGGRVYVGTLRGVIHAMDADSGKDVWTYRAGGAILHACAVANGNVFVGAGDGKIYAINAGDGTLTWSIQTGKAIWNAPVVHENLVIVGGRDGKLYACDQTTGKVIWSPPTGGPILSSPAIDEKLGRVYVGCEDMQVYAVDLKTGQQIWRSAKLPGVSFRGYHPVIAPDGSVMITVTPCAGGDAIQQVMLDMVKEVFGDFASWRHKKDENDRLRQQNFELMRKPETYAKQMDYLRKRLTDQPAYQTFFVLDAQTGKQKFITPLVYAESMNGPCSPPLVLADGKIVVKYSALLRSRYEHYSPFLNVGYLDIKTGDITPIMDQTRTYGWYDSLLLVHDEQSQLSAGGRVLFNTHQDNVNGLDLDTLKGYPEPMCFGVHEVQPGVANSLWAIYLSGKALPVGWEWLARGTAVYGGGSAIDVPIVIDGDSFYYLPTHEINSGCAIIAYRMDKSGDAGKRLPEPKEQLTQEDWKKISRLKWDWDTLGMPRLDSVLKKGLPEKMAGTRLAPSIEQAKKAAAAVTDEQLDQTIWPELPSPGTPGEGRVRAFPEAAQVKEELSRAVEELISAEWRPLLFPAAKAPGEAYRLFVDPTETLYTLALAYPLLPAELQQRVKAHVAKLSGDGGPLAGPLGAKLYDPQRGAVRSAYDPAPESMMRISDDLVRPETGRVYPLWLWAQVTGDWEKLTRDWPAIKKLINPQEPKNEPDCGNARLAGLIAACRTAKHLGDQPAIDQLVPATRAALRRRLEYELAYTEGGLIFGVSNGRTICGRWRHLTPDVAAFLSRYAGNVHRRLVEVYVGHHRPTWWLAWNVELLWRNEAPFSFPTMALEVFSAKSMILREPPEKLAPLLDLPWCKGDECHVQKLAMLLK